MVKKNRYYFSNDKTQEKQLTPASKIAPASLPKNEMVNHDNAPSTGSKPKAGFSTEISGGESQRSAHTNIRTHVPSSSSRRLFMNDDFGLIENFFSWIEKELLLSTKKPRPVEEPKQEPINVVLDKKYNELVQKFSKISDQLKAFKSNQQAS